MASHKHCTAHSEHGCAHQAPQVHEHSHDHGSCHTDEPDGAADDDPEHRPRSSSSTKLPQMIRGDSTRSVFNVQGLCCQSEARLIDEQLQKLDGIFDLTINIPAGTVAVYYQPESLTPAQITASIARVGLKAELRQSVLRKPAGTTTFANPQFITMAIGVVLLVLASIAHVVTGLNAAAIPLFIASIIIGGAYVFRAAFTAARLKQLDISVLMTIAVVGAVGIGEWFEAATVVVLFAFAEWLEGMSMTRARRAISEMMELAPPLALVRRGLTEVEVPIDDVQVGDIVIVKPGSKIPVDGTVLSGKSDVNEAPITGESVAALKSVGSTVFAGTLNGRGSMVVRTDVATANSTLAKIIDTVEDARANQSEAERFIDRFARIYTPAVVAIAVLVTTIPPLLFNGVWETWFYRALVFLVIACPCALVISTPIATVAGLTRAAREGILIKGGRILEQLAKIKAIAFDKTGTLTIGKPSVISIVPVDGITKELLLEIAAAAELNSEHHLADAIVREARARNLAIDDAKIEHFSAEIGEGVEAEILLANTTVEDPQFAKVLVGTPALFKRAGIDTTPFEANWIALEEQAQTVVGISRDGAFIGLIGIADTPRPQAAGAIAQLDSLGIASPYLLTGDNRATALAIAHAVGLNDEQHVHARLLPQDKVARIQELVKTHSSVAMVGDGINDAPALAAATVGIAMGAAGTDIALESADVALMSDDLQKIPESVQIARKTVAIIRQNIAIALVLKLIFLTLAIFGLATLWMAIAADMGASLIVIFNALRLLGRQKAQPAQNHTHQLQSHHV